MVHDGQEQKADLPCLQDIRRQPKIHQGQVQMSTEDVTIGYKEDIILQNFDRKLAEIEASVLSNYNKYDLGDPKIVMLAKNAIIEAQRPIIEKKAKYLATHIELTKSFINNCCNIEALREFLCNALDKINENENEIKNLKNALRWREFSEEKPEHHQRILVYSRDYKTELRRWDEGCKFYVEVQEIYTHWMPLPKEPEDFT